MIEPPEAVTLAGQITLELRVLRRNAVPYVLGLRAMNGPQSGVIQAFAAGQPIGPRFDLYAPEKRPGAVIWPLGQLPGDSDEVELRVVAQNPASAGCHVGLDYFRWEPLIIHPDSGPGVWATVLRTQGCELGLPISIGLQSSCGPSSVPTRLLVRR